MVLLEGQGESRARVVPVGEEDLDLVNARFAQRIDGLRGNLVVRLHQHFARFMVDDLGDRQRAFQVLRLDLDLLYTALDKLRVNVVDDLFSLGHDHRLSLRVPDLSRSFGSDEVPGKCSIKCPPFPADCDRGVKSAQDLGVGNRCVRALHLCLLLVTYGAQKRGCQKLALPVDPNIKNVLLVVFKLHPGAAIGDDLGENKGAPRVRLEKDARRPVQLADDDTLGAVYDERAVFGHQRDVSKVDFLLLDVPDGLAVGFGVLVPDHQSHRDLERNRKGHPALLAFLHRVLDVKLHRTPAELASRVFDLVFSAAVPAGAAFGIVGTVYNDPVALHTVRSQVVEALEISTLALPVSDRVLHKLERRRAAKVVNRENRIKNRLQPDVLAFRGRDVHLQKAMIGLPLDFNEVWNGDARMNLGKIHPVPIDVGGCDIRHGDFFPRQTLFGF